MSSLTWREAARRVAGTISGASQPDAQEAAKDALEETLQDWDTRRDWRYTQVVAADITIAAGDSTFDLPTNFKKPYVAYLVSNQQPLHFVERQNWHRYNPGSTTQTIPYWYTLFDDASTGKGMIMPTSSVGDTLVVLYHRSVTYRDSDDAYLDIPERWQGYILAGAKHLLVGNKVSNDKAVFWERKYEAGVKKAKEDDLRVPDQFLSFVPQSHIVMPPWIDPNSTWQAVWGVE